MTGPTTPVIPVVSVVDERLRSASICLAVDYGARHDPDGCGGLAHLLEHVLMSYRLPGGDSLSGHVARRGGEVNAETGLEHMLFHAQVLAEDLTEVLELLLRAVSTPEHAEDVLTAERAAVFQELAAAAADPADVVQDAFLAALFPDHPLGRPVAGSAGEITRLDGARLLAGHREEFLASRAVLAVVAPVAVTGAGIGTGWVPAPARPARPLGPVAREPVAWPEEFSWVSVGGRSAARGDRRRHAFSVLAQLCASSSASPMYRQLRGEQGLAYSFHAWDRPYTEAGAWRVLVGTEPANCQSVVDTVTTTLAGLAEHGPAPDDLTDARRQVRGQLVFETERPLDHARLLAHRALVNGPQWSVEAELAAIAEVTAEQVRAAAAEIAGDLVVSARPTASRNLNR
ncbi:pitrilysin family protein [Amycolatopsis sp. PS_44_ISF1]|uniref:M16 family metallopeptidase n=1 Tax=Amycolatopsis sp. PS_44_ISF1 TaxID=2974917 RepID=UPI0028DFCF8D|nr:pitrilysin family protein [Amycolatopsis sp. PS_44_ISF1]MDT8912743.1 insulinase family protein [Amycolatopsis sp. PS_44_ISF1]